MSFPTTIRLLTLLVAALASARAASAADPFTIVVLPDTQYYSSTYPATFTAQTQWIAQHAQRMNIRFVLHEGDITDNNNDLEWSRASDSLSVLEGVVPFALVPGNHDMGSCDTRGHCAGADVRNTRSFNTTFPVSRFAGTPSFGGSFPAGLMDNSWHVFEGGGIDWLVLALEFGPRDHVLDWANAVVAAHPQHRVMVVTHTYLYPDNTLQGSNPEHLQNPHIYGVASEPGGVNDGQDMWDKFVKRHANMTFVFNGHITDGTAGLLVGIGDHGNRVYQMHANYQHLPLGGMGLMRVLRIEPDQDRVLVSTFSPTLNQYVHDPYHEFFFKGAALGSPTTAQAENLGFQGPGSVHLGLEGSDLTTSLGQAALSVGAAAPSSPVVLFVGDVFGALPVAGGTLVPYPWLQVSALQMTDAFGNAQFPMLGGDGTPQVLYLQAVVPRQGVYEFSNALRLHVGS